MHGYTGDRALADVSMPFSNTELVTMDVNEVQRSRTDPGFAEIQTGAASTPSSQRS